MNSNKCWNKVRKMLNVYLFWNNGKSSWFTWVTHLNYYLCKKLHFRKYISHESTILCFELTISQLRFNQTHSKIVIRFKLPRITTFLHNVPQAHIYLLCSLSRHLGLVNNNLFSTRISYLPWSGNKYFIHVSERPLNIINNIR